MQISLETCLDLPCSAEHELRQLTKACNTEQHVPAVGTTLRLRAESSRGPSIHLVVLSAMICSRHDLGTGPGIVCSVSCGLPNGMTVEEFKQRVAQYNQNTKSLSDI